MRKFIGVLVVAAAMLRCGQLQAQVTNTITSASLSSLQDALVSGANVIQLQFSATLTTATPLEVVEDVIIDGTGFSPYHQRRGHQPDFHRGPGCNFDHDQRDPEWRC